MRPHLPCQHLGKATRPTDVSKQSFISPVLSKLPFGFPQAVFISTVTPLRSCCISGSPAELCRISESGSSYLNPYKCRVLKQHSWIFQPTLLSLHPKSHWFVLLWRSSDFCKSPPLVNSIKPWFQPWTSICLKKRQRCSHLPSALRLLLLGYFSAHLWTWVKYPKDKHLREQNPLFVQKQDGRFFSA